MRIHISKEKEEKIYYLTHIFDKEFIPGLLKVDTGYLDLSHTLISDQKTYEKLKFNVKWISMLAP